MPTLLPTLPFLVNLTISLFLPESLLMIFVACPFRKALSIDISEILYTSESVTLPYTSYQDAYTRLGDVLRRPMTIRRLRFPCVKRTPTVPSVSPELVSLLKASGLAHATSVGF